MKRFFKISIRRYNIDISTSQRFKLRLDYDEAGPAHSNRQKWYIKIVPTSIRT